MNKRLALLLAFVAFAVAVAFAQEPTTTTHAEESSDDHTSLPPTTSRAATTTDDDGSSIDDLTTTTKATTTVAPATTTAAHTYLRVTGKPETTEAQITTVIIEYGGSVVDKCYPATSGSGYTCDASFASATSAQSLHAAITAGTVPTLLSAAYYTPTAAPSDDDSSSSKTGIIVGVVIGVVVVVGVLAAGFMMMKRRRTSTYADTEGGVPMNDSTQFLPPPTSHKEDASK